MKVTLTVLALTKQRKRGDLGKIEAHQTRVELVNKTRTLKLLNKLLRIAFELCRPMIKLRSLRKLKNLLRRNMQRLSQSIQRDALKMTLLMSSFWIHKYLRLKIWDILTIIFWMKLHLQNLLDNQFFYLKGCLTGNMTKPKNLIIISWEKGFLKQWVLVVQPIS